mgnify:CR=1 FL=1
MHLSKIVFTLLLAFLFTATGCDDDDGGNRIPLTYDPATTIYATFGNGRENASEVVIELSSGKVDSIPGTSKFVALSAPLGPRYFQTFSPDQRIVPGIDNQLSIQSLETFQYNSFTSEDPSDLTPLINPQFITRGRTDNEILVLDTDQSVWRADLQSFIIERWINDISPQGRSVVYLFQLNEGELLRIFATTGANTGSVQMMDVLDTEADEIIDFVVENLDKNYKTFWVCKAPG